VISALSLHFAAFAHEDGLYTMAAKEMPDEIHRLAPLPQRGAFSKRRRCSLPRGNKGLWGEVMMLALGCLAVVCGVFAMLWADGNLVLSRRA
jgi:hypothetical protein